MPNYMLVDPPQIAPRKYGLFSVAERLPMEDHAALEGIEWFTDNCQFFSRTTNDVVCVGTPSRTATVTSRDTVHAVAHPVYVYVQCAGINERKDAQARAVELLDRTTERAAESILATALAADTSAFDYTPGTVPTLRRAIAEMEGILDDNYVGVGTMATLRAPAALAASDGDTVDIHGNHLETSLGTQFLGGNAFILGPAAATAGAGNAWVWGMGKVQVRESPNFVSDVLMVQSASVNEVQSLAITGTPTGGSYTLTFDGQTTTGIAYNAGAATVQAALVALSNVDAGDIVVTGTYPTFTITFGGQYAGENAAPITATGSFTGGTAPAATVTTTTAGVNNFGDNTYRVMAQKLLLVSYDCFAAGIKAVLPL